MWKSAKFYLVHSWILCPICRSFKLERKRKKEKKHISTLYKLIIYCYRFFMIGCSIYEGTFFMKIPKRLAKKASFKLIFWNSKKSLSYWIKDKVKRIFTCYLWQKMIVFWDSIQRFSYFMKNSCSVLNIFNFFLLFCFSVFLNRKFHIILYKQTLKENKQLTTTKKGLIGHNKV